ncbi:hypothetical protein LPJ72_001788 [Coemansia sp. Benny D160-2]|nr:hypothetical protein LPJ72_001788 [Coemansia sp. Benny D160-2]
MSSRKHSRDYDDADDPINRSDFIHVGTEMAQRQGHSRRAKKHRPRGAQSKKAAAEASAEWKPSVPFVSSRDRRAERLVLRPEDFMDAQDLADLDRSSDCAMASGDAGGLGWRTPRAAGCHGADYGVDAAALPDSPAGADVLPRPLATLFRRAALSRPGKAAPDRSMNNKKKRRRNVLSFSAAFDDDDELGIGDSHGASRTQYAGGSRSSASSGGRFLPTPGDPRTPSALEALASSSIRSGPGLAAKHRVFGMFVLSGLLESEAAGSACVNGGPGVPAGFTGQHRPLQPRWDAVPATGSQSQLHRHTDPQSNGRSNGALLATAADRAKLRIVDDGLGRGAGSSCGHAEPDSEYSHDSSALAGRQTSNGCGARETSAMTAQLAHPGTAMLSRFVKASRPDSGEGGARPPDATASNGPPASSGSSAGRASPARTVADWAPSLLLCKRMRVLPPSTAAKAAPAPLAPQQSRSARKRAADFIESIQHPDDAASAAGPPVDLAAAAVVSEQNAAVAAQRPDMSLFEAIFG